MWEETIVVYYETLPINVQICCSGLSAELFKHYTRCQKQLKITRGARNS